MKIIIIAISILFLLIFAILIYLFYLFKSKEKVQNKIIEENQLTIKYKLSWKAYLIISITCFFIIASFFAPLFFTSQTEIKDFDFTTTGQIGDTIGGLMNPFVALAGVLITGLAFYVQYKANELQRELFLLNQEDTKAQLQSQIDYQNKQNKLQQIESQFYEMLKLHRENITEMRINGYDFEEFKSNKDDKKKTLKKFDKVQKVEKYLSL